MRRRSCILSRFFRARALTHEEANADLPSNCAGRDLAQNVCHDLLVEHGLLHLGRAVDGEKVILHIALRHADERALVGRQTVFIALHELVEDLIVPRCLHSSALPARARVLLLSSALRPSVRARPARRRAAVRHNRRAAAARPTEAALPRRALRSLWALPRPFPV